MDVSPPSKCRLCEIIQWSVSVWLNAPAIRPILTHCHLSADHDTTFLFQLADLWYIVSFLLCLFLYFIFTVLTVYPSLYAVCLISTWRNTNRTRYLYFYCFSSLSFHLARLYPSSLLLLTMDQITQENFRIAQRLLYGLY